MARIESQLTIKAPVELVYEVSQDYSVRYEWDPFPENIALLHGATKIEKGTGVAIRAKSGLSMEVEFVQLQPPNTAAIKMTKGPFVLRSFSGSWLFKSLAEGETHAKFVYSIKAKWWTIPVMSEWIVSRYFSRVIRSRLDGLRNYCEARVRQEAFIIKCRS